MRLDGNIERTRLVGAAAVQAWDAVLGRQVDVRCEVTALSASSGKPIQRAVSHASGLQSFLTLKPGLYRLLLVPRTRGYLPSLRALSLPPDAAAPLWVDAPLRPAPDYPNIGVGTVVLRGTLQWNPQSPEAPAPPVRWALVRGRLEDAQQPGVVLSRAWTRSNARGDFALLLAAPEPDSDGRRPSLNAVVEVGGTPRPPGASLAEEDYSDLALDDGTDDEIFAREPSRRTLTAQVVPGRQYSLNTDSYGFTPPGSGRELRQSVILLT
jgi:hypothetical protein